MTLKRLLAAAAATLFMSGAAHASTLVFANAVFPDNNIAGVCSTPTLNTDRTDICNSLGAPDGNASIGGFTSTGNYDSLTYSFGIDFVGPIYIWEITGNRNPNWVEELDVQIVASDNSGNDFLGTITNTDGVPDGDDRWKVVFDTAPFAGPFAFLTVSAGAGPGDKFDIDAIGVTPVPLPAAAWLLLGGIGGLAALKRRKKA